MGGLCDSSSSHQKHGNMHHNSNRGINQMQMNNFNQNQNYPNNNNTYQEIDPVLRRRGARYLIRQVKHDQLEVIPGGKMPIKLVFSLDKSMSFAAKDPLKLSFKISISDVKNNQIFKHMTTIQDLNQEDMVYANQIITEYYFEIDQKIKVEVIYNNMKVHENLVSTAKINGSLNHTEEIPIFLSGPNTNPDFKLLIISDPISEELSRLAISFDMRLESNCNDEFFAVFENTFKNKKQKIYKTEEVRGPFPKIVARDLAFGDLSFDKSNDQEFDILFYTVRGNSIFKLGTITSSLKYLDNLTIDVKDPKTNATVCKASIATSRRNIKRFIDYIYTDKLQISMICAIDFTGSNREPTDPRSLHFISSEPNQYQQALQASSSIVSYYDSDKKFPVYGFGAQYKNDLSCVVSHCFNLNFSNENPEVEGVAGIMQAYQNAIPYLIFSGPTHFSPCIYNTIQYVKSKGIDNSYYIVLIITDGQINDMDQTRAAILEASVLPISIIIVGVGSADFSCMNVLDGDEYPLVDVYGKKIRDIVQFVSYDMKYAMNIALFSQELLYEIPAQVENYFRSIGK